MALNFNDTNITKLYFNGVEKKILNYNGRVYFVKQFTLSQSEAMGTTVSINRTSSPNQNAATGSVSTGSTIYYGDVITISVEASSGYDSPVLYVDIGDGNGSVLRTSPFSFTAINNVSYSAIATQSNEWQTVFSGSQAFSDIGSITVEGLEEGDAVQITANVTFVDYYISEYDQSITEGGSRTAGVNRGILPTTIQGNISSVNFTRSGSVVSFSFDTKYQYAKGYYLYEVPVSVVITEVRRKSV